MHTLIVIFLIKNKDILRQKLHEDRIEFESRLVIYVKVHYMEFAIISKRSIIHSRVNIINFRN